MSQSRDLYRHIGQLKEIRTILNAMKNMAFMEIHKLARYQNRQGLAVSNIEQAAAEFLAFFPGFALETDCLRHICIVVGTERGFCGDFNERLITTISHANYSGLIAIGGRLANRLNGNELPVISYIAGANSAEEVPAIINQLIDDINAYAKEQNAAVDCSSGIRVTIMYHNNAAGPAVKRQILPPFPLQAPSKSPQGEPPLLNLEPSRFFSDLVYHYLFAALNEIFYISLIAENQSRLQHLEGAVTHLDDECIAMQRKLQRYRQEEITEEIEVILLTAENIG